MLFPYSMSTNSARHKTCVVFCFLPGEAELAHEVELAAVVLGDLAACHFCRQASSYRGILFTDSPAR